MFTLCWLNLRTTQADKQEDSLINSSIGSEINENQTTPTISATPNYSPITRIVNSTPLNTLNGSTIRVRHRKDFPNLSRTLLG